MKVKENKINEFLTKKNHENCVLKNYITKIIIVSYTICNISVPQILLKDFKEIFLK